MPSQALKLTLSFGFGGRNVAVDSYRVSQNIWNIFPTQPLFFNQILLSQNVFPYA